MEKLRIELEKKTISTVASLISLLVVSKIDSTSSLVFAFMIVPHGLDDPLDDDDDFGFFISCSFRLAMAVD